NYGTIMYVNEKAMSSNRFNPCVGGIVGYLFVDNAIYNNNYNYGKIDTGVMTNSQKINVKDLYGEEYSDPYH
ncbi:MAG: hypothetical protein OSJ74_07665, partial [Clostridia bacterium]|nr:hypothetical protein [Clostridia bacterium]